MAGNPAIIHLVSHTHWDREWYLPFQEFRLKLVYLIDQLLDILDRDPEFRHFLLDGQTIVLEDYLEMRPEREADIRRHVQSGRLQIGPWHVLQDEFLVSPEGIIRNLLQGNRTARRFGAKMQVGYIPDPFGHIAQMPQILRGFGIELTCLQRGLADEPCELWWRAPDSSQVFLAYLRDGYGNAAQLPSGDPQDFAASALRAAESLLAHSAASQVLLMQGSDHTGAVPETPRLITYANDNLKGTTFLHASLQDAIQSICEEITAGSLPIPVVTGELRQCKRHPLLPGVLSTRVWIKQRLHACETLLEKWAEPFSTFAELINRHDAPIAASHESLPGRAGMLPGRLDHPAPVLRKAWRLLMENYPHDSACGCSIDQVHAEMRPRFDQVEQVAGEITRQSLSFLAAHVDCAPPPGLPASSAVVVFNPAGSATTGLVEATLPLPADSAVELVDASGIALPTRMGVVEEHDIAFMTLDAQGLFNLANSVTGGRVSNLGPASGMLVQSIDLKQQGDTVGILVTLAEGGTPDDSVLEEAMSSLATMVAAGQVRTFILQAKAVSTRVQFIAPDVPPVGYRTFWVRPRSRQVTPANVWNHQPFQIENEALLVTVDPQDGTVTLLDKVSGAQFQGLNHFIDGGDCGDSYNYCPPARDRLVTGGVVRQIQASGDDLEKFIEIQLELPVPVGLSEDCRSRSQQTAPLQITTRLSLHPGSRRLDVRTGVENHASDHRLRVHFPVPFSLQAAGQEFATGGHFEVRMRSTSLPAWDATWVEQPRLEMPQRDFAAISDGATGLAILSRGLREVQALENEGCAEIALTLLRCVGWLSRDDLTTRCWNAGPAIATPQAQLHEMSVFEYAILPFAGDLHGEAMTSVCREAGAYQAPMLAVPASLPGEVQDRRQLPSTGSFLQVEPPELVVSAIKEAEDGSSWIVRAYNLSDRVIQARFRPWRRFPAERVSLAEQAIEPLTAGPDGSLHLEVKPHEIVTIKFSTLERTPGC